jgi:hypothetical protein
MRGWAKPTQNVQVLPSCLPRSGMRAGKELGKILADHPDLCRSRGEPELFSAGWRYVIKTQLVVAKAVNMFSFVRRQTRDDFKACFENVCLGTIEQKTGIRGLVG